MSPVFFIVTLSKYRLVVASAGWKSCVTSRLPIFTTEVAVAAVKTKLSGMMPTPAGPVIASSTYPEVKPYEAPHPSQRQPSAVASMLFGRRRRPTAVVPVGGMQPVQPPNDGITPCVLRSPSGMMPSMTTPFVMTAPPLVLRN